MVLVFVVADLDMIPTELHWPEGRSVVFQARAKGEAHIFRADLGLGRLSSITSGPREVHGFDISQSAGKLVYLANDFQHMDELYLSNLDGSSERQLTHLNSELWAQLSLEPVERVQYKSTDGLPIDGFLVKPLEWQPGRKYPLVLVIHGGPDDMFSVGWY